MLPTPVSTNNTSVCQHQDVITLVVMASTWLDDCITRDGSNVLAEENVNKYNKRAGREGWLEIQSVSTLGISEPDSFNDTEPGP